MRYTLILSAALLIGSTLNAQVSFPAPSPACEITQSIGLTEVNIKYSRPSARDRTIFGDLVPYGEIWRTGANASTTLSFDKAVILGAQEVPAGTYALFCIPENGEWTIILSNNVESWGPPNPYLVEEEQCRFKAKPRRLSDKVETFTILPTNLRDDRAMITLMWENTAVDLPLQLGTHEQVTSALDKTLGGPDGRFFYQAARYYHDAGVEQDKAMEYIDIAIQQKGYDRFFVLRTKALIQAKAGDYTGAIATAKMSSEKAREEGNMEYIKMNDASIQEWSSKGGK